MKKIGYIPYYNYNVVSKGEAQSDSPNTSNAGKGTQYLNKEYMTPQISLASRAYGLSFVNYNKTIPQMSIEKMVEWLESQGKVMGEDFDIDSTCTMGNVLLTLKNKQGKEELIIHYDDGNYSAWNCYELIEYKNDKPYQMTCRNKDNKVNMTTKIYDRNNSVAENFVDENLTYNTTPQEYEQYLKENNIKYDIEYSGNEDNNRSVNIDIYDKNGKRTDGIWFYYGEHKFDEHCQWLSKSNYNQNDEEIRRIEFNPSTTEVTTYLNYLH